MPGMHYCIVGRNESTQGRACCKFTSTREHHDLDMTRTRKGLMGIVWVQERGTHIWTGPASHQSLQAPRLGRYSENGLLVGKKGRYSASIQFAHPRRRCPPGCLAMLLGKLCFLGRGVLLVVAKRRTGSILGCLACVGQDLSLEAPVLLELVCYWAQTLTNTNY